MYRRLFSKILRRYFGLNPRYLYYRIFGRKSDLGVCPESMRGNNSSYKKFVIIAHARSGSTLLIQLLRNHPRVVAFSELFLHDRVGSPMDYFNDDNLRWLALRNKYPIEFLEQQVFGSYAGHVDAVGFKFFPEQLDNRRLKKVWVWLDNHPEIKIIFLVRENYLETYTSLMMASRTGRYSASAKDAGGKRPKVTLNLDKCLREFRRRDHYNKLGETHLKGHDSWVVTYEELKDDVLGFSENMQKFIGLDVADLKVALRKQEKRPLSQIIENYGEIKEKLAPTEWNRFFS